MAHRRRSAGPSDLERTDPWVVFRGLIPFVWPKGRPDLRRRVVAAFAVLALAKVVTVAVPIAFKEITDALTAFSGEGASAGAQVATGLG